MTVQWDETVRNGVVEAWETAIGASPTIELRTGAQPANCAAADAGTLIAEYDLGADWAANPVAGVKALADLPLVVNALAAGALGHYRIKSSGGACREQGSITATGGGGDMTVDNVNVASGQQVRITAYTKTAPGA